MSDGSMPGHMAGCASAEQAFQVADSLVREILEATCARLGLPLDSAVAPGEPARNYELADRIGIGPVFGRVSLGGDVMRIGPDRRVSRWFFRVETDQHRWSIRLHFWLHRCNWLRLNRQPKFTEVMIARCVVLSHSRWRQP